MHRRGSCTDVYVQCIMFSLYDRAAHNLHVGLQQRQRQQSQSERRTHRDHLVFLPPRPHRKHTIRIGGVVARSGRPGGPSGTRLSRGWSGCVGHPVQDLLLSFSRSTPFPLLPLTLSAPSTTVKLPVVRRPYFRLHAFELRCSQAEMAEKQFNHLLHPCTYIFFLKAIHYFAITVRFYFVFTFYVSACNQKNRGKYSLENNVFCRC